MTPCVPCFVWSVCIFCASVERMFKPGLRFACGWRVGGWCVMDLNDQFGNALPILMILSWVHHETFWIRPARRAKLTRASTANLGGKLPSPQPLPVFTAPWLRTKWIYLAIRCQALSVAILKPALSKDVHSIRHDVSVEDSILPNLTHFGNGFGNLTKARHCKRVSRYLLSCVEAVQFMRLTAPKIWAPVEMFLCHTVLPRKEKEPSVRQVNPSCFDLKGLTDHWWFHNPCLLIQRPFAKNLILHASDVFEAYVRVCCTCYACIILSSANCEWTCEAKEIHCGLEPWPTRSQGARSLKRLGFNMIARL